MKNSNLRYHLQNGSHYSRQKFNDSQSSKFSTHEKELEEGISIVLFSEGTFTNEPQEQLNPFQIGGYSLAIMQQADILPILYLDTARRLHPSKLLQITPGMNRAVFYRRYPHRMYKSKMRND